MNYIRHLNAFLTIIRNDKRLTAAHVSLYLAAFYYWNLNHFQNPFPVYRDEMMRLSKIGSKNTYHKCLKELHKTNYVFYFPATSRYQPAQISIVRMDKNKPDPMAGQPDLFSPKNGTHTVPNLSLTCPNNETHTVPKMGHPIKHINIKHKTVCKTPTEIFNKNQKLIGQINALACVPNMGHIGHSQKENKENPKRFIPSLTEIESFFQSQKFSLEEAKKFHLYNEAKGWMLTATIPIADWHALAHKWMMNKSNDVKNNKPAENSPHQVKTDKNYGEPL